jgi:uncharacterized membrane protein (TIGR02234 family)
MIRIGQLLLLVSAGALWLASRMTWVEVSSFSGLGQPKTMTLSGAQWSTMLVPLAVILGVSVLKSSIGPTWQLRLLAVIVGGVGAVTGYLAIDLWRSGDIADRAARLADVPVAELVGAQPHYGGAVVTMFAAIATLAAVVLLLRSPARDRSATDKYSAPARRREAARAQNADGAPSERMMWDALDEGRDPTDPDNEGR